MMIKADDIIRINGEKCYVLFTFEDTGKNYGFVNKITEDEEDVTNDYYLIELDATGSFQIVMDQLVIDRLNPKIQELLKKAIEEVGIDMSELEG